MLVGFGVGGVKPNVILVNKYKNKGTKQCNGPVYCYFFFSSYSNYPVDDIKSPFSLSYASDPTRPDVLKAEEREEKTPLPFSLLGRDQTAAMDTVGVPHKKHCFSSPGMECACYF